MENDVLRIAGKEFHSRLIVGTGKYRSFQEMARAHEASGAEIVTVAVRRVEPYRPQQRVLAGLHRPHEALYSSQHCGLLLRR